MSEIAIDIDWKAEMRKYEREFLGLPPERNPAEKRAQLVSALKEQERRQAQTGVVGTWARFCLVTTLAASIVLWPYPRACGMDLFLYLGAAVAIVIGALWVAVCTWKHRMPTTHTLALLLGLWGLGLLQLEVLPRVGYAKVERAQAASWRCSA